MSTSGEGDNSATSNEEAIRQAGQTYNTSVDLRQATQPALLEQVARELMGRSITSEDQYVPRPPPTPADDENTEVETRLVTIHGTELNENGEIRRYRSPKSQMFYGYKRQTEMYYHHLKEELFVERRACEKGLEILKQNNVVTILGHCGDGRTTLGCWFLKQLSAELDCDAVRINSPKDWTRVLEVDARSGEKLIVMMDDIFGSVGLADFMFEEWRPNESYMWSFVQKKTVYLVFTSKKHLYTQGVGRMPYSDLFQKKFILDLTADELQLTWEEKKLMLQNHLSYRGLDEDIALNLPHDCPNIGFPLLINQFCMVDDFQKWGLRFFTNPVLWYARDLECVSSTEPEVWGILILILLGGVLRPTDYMMYSENKEGNEKFKKILNFTTLRDGFPATKLMHLCEHIDRVFVRFDKQENGYRFIDHYMKEAAWLAFGKWHYRETIIRCSLDFLCEYIVTHRYDLERPEKDIFLVFSPCYYIDLNERFVKEFLAGNVERLVSHRAFLDDSYTEAFFKSMKEKDELVKVLQAKDTKCKMGMLSLSTAYGQESILREITNCGVFSKLSAKEWVKNEKQTAMDIAKDYNLHVMEQMLSRL